MKRSGYDDADPDPDPDWALRDEKFATIEERDFVRKEFLPIPALVSRLNRRHRRRYNGQPFDEAEWELVPETWDHEHCEVCFEHIMPGMTYWESGRDTLLCDRCYDRYLRPPGVA